MQTQIYDYPWPHLVTDSALDANEWAQLKAYLHEIRPGEIAPNTDNYIRKLVGVETDPTDLAIHGLLSSKVFDLYQHYYERLGGQPLEGDLTVALEFRYIGVGYRYGKIHTDIPLKRMSNVLYVAPETEDPNLGTDLYLGPTEDTLVRNSGWKSNRIMSFVADQQRTWHDFGNASDQVRITINMILGYTSELVPRFT